MRGAAEPDSYLAKPLTASGRVDAKAIARAREYAAAHGGSVSDALLRLELIGEGDFLRVFAEQYATHFVKADNLRSLDIDDAVLDRVGVRVAERLRVCPIRWEPEPQELHVVAAVPLIASLEAELKEAAGAKGVSVYIATPGAVAALVRRYYYREKGAFHDVTANGAGPQMPRGAESAATPDEEESPREVTVSKAVKPVEVQPRLLEGKTTMVNLNEFAEVMSLRKENARYRIAQEFHRRVSLERSSEAMTERILEVLFDLLPADGAAVWRNDGQLASRGKRPGQTVDVPQAVIDQTVSADRPVLTHNALIDERFDHSKSVVARGVKSVMAVPLRTRNASLGVLYVESLSLNAAFTDDDLSLLDSIGAQAAMLLDNTRLISQVEQEVENRVNLSRFLSAAAVEEVLSGRMNLNVAGQLADVTLLFADLRGFTTLSSHMRPDEVVAFLNTFFAEAVRAVEQNHGIVDKFIGDCVMAMWGAPVPRDDDARNAIKAGLELVERCRQIRVGDQTLEIGVGINSGSAVVGAIGARQRSDYTAVGATVNLAARLCSIAPSNAVLITSDTLLRAGPGIETESGEPVVLKGLDVPIVPYHVVSMVQPLQLSNAIATPNAKTEPGRLGPFARKTR